MEVYKTKEFTLPKLKGMSETSIAEHLKLYAGYVKHANLIKSKLSTLSEDDVYMKAELGRRFSFEFSGMRNHELYFETLVNGKTDIKEDTVLYMDIVKNFESWDNFIKILKETALTRGVGWAILSYDIKEKSLIISWVDEQHLGHLPETYPVYAIDMWEHSYVLDYLPSGKKDYVDDYIYNSDFDYIASRYQDFLNSFNPK